MGSDAARAIDAVLFDLHGVLTSSPWAALAEVGDLELMVGDYTTDGDHPWHRLERGEIGLAEYLAAATALAADAGAELDFMKLRGFSERIVVNDHVVDRVRSLKADGYKTALVTNNLREIASGWRELFPVDDLFDVVVDSSVVGLRKPNPAIFALALEHLGGIAPDRAVFLDDAPGNVDGARRAGLRAILVDDPDAALRELDRLLSGDRDD